MVTTQTADNVLKSYYLGAVTDKHIECVSHLLDNNKDKEN